MIIGRGLIAMAFDKSFKDHDSFTIFASGVSNSNETDPAQYLREKNMLLDYMNNDSILVYFSTCSIFDSYSKESRYVHHKMEMEELIRSKSSRFVIFRLPQVAGFSNNSNTLMNYFSNKIIKEEKFELLNVERNIIDIDDVVRIIYSFLHYDSEKYLDKVINIAYPNNIKVTSLVRLMESFYNKKAIFTMREIENYSFFVELEEFVKNCFPVSNTNDYLKSILTKYYL